MGRVYWVVRACDGVPDTCEDLGEVTWPDLSDGGEPEPLYGCPWWLCDEADCDDVEHSLNECYDIPF